MVKTDPLFVSTIYNTIQPAIVPAISAICVLIFTSEKWRKSGNYARNPGPDDVSGTRSGSCHRRRVPARKVLLSSRLFIAPHTYGLSDTSFQGMPSDPDPGRVKTALLFLPTIYNTIRPEIVPPKGAKSGFFGARWIPIPAERTAYRGFRKTIVSVFRKTVPVTPSGTSKTG